MIGTVMDHICNAYCRDGLYCELFYVSEGASPGEVTQALGYYRGLRVERLEPALEAPAGRHMAGRRDHGGLPPGDRADVGVVAVMGPTSLLCSARIEGAGAWLSANGLQTNAP